MALAEARAAWQRTANRCLVQEDAKRAPKLARCPSASPSVKPADQGPANAADGQDATSLGFPPYSQNPSYSNLPSNSRWWLQPQPNYGYLMTVASEESNLPKSEMQSIGSDASSFSKISGIHLEEEDESFYFDESTNTESIPDSSVTIAMTPLKKDLGARKQEHEVIYDKNLQNSLLVEDAGDYYEVTKKGTVGCKSAKQFDEVCFDSECNWLGDEKTEPWWRSADKDELAHLVAQRSLSVVENCDLPQPQKAHSKKGLYGDNCCFDHEAIYLSPVDPKPRIGGFSSVSTRERSTLASESSFSRKWESVEGHFQAGPDNRPLRSEDAMPEALMSDNDPSKAQLLEALRHSQTRAREAENAAKQAYAEKEHIVKLVFRQASQLFAYKQWFQLLQLENLYSQIRNNKHQPMTSVFPVMLPWVPQRTRKLRKNWHRAARGKHSKRGRTKCDICKYAVVFAVGLSLVGAGLLLGWTVGWMLPTF